VRKAGCDEDDLQPTDFLCDFCGSVWSDDRPMVEGHQGSLICRRCLDLAFTEVWLNGQGVSLPDTSPVPSKCILCLEHRDEPCFASPLNESGNNGIFGCKRCIKQSVVILERDPEFGYSRPGGRER
jgi:hypothetical protein